MLLDMAPASPARISEQRLAASATMPDRSAHDGAPANWRRAQACAAASKRAGTLLAAHEFA
jgi:hypothetical protein